MGLRCVGTGGGRRGRIGRERGSGTGPNQKVMHPKSMWRERHAIHTTTSRAFAEEWVARKKDSHFDVITFIKPRRALLRRKQRLCYALSPDTRISGVAAIYLAGDALFSPFFGSSTGSSNCLSEP